jgi:ElaB/YqjD/DUF883 family membrane-anchored ribosome-binding protein
MSTAEITREKLLSDLKALTTDVEELVRATADRVDENISSLRERVMRGLESGKQMLAREELSDKSIQAVKDAATYVQQNPWSAFGVILGIGIALGLLLWSQSAR